MNILRSDVDFRFTDGEQKEARLLPTLYGQATRAVAMAGKQKLERDTIAETAGIEIDGTKLLLKELEGLNSTLGISTHKLLSVAVAEFSRNNHTGAGKSRALKETRVSIPLKEYASWCGYDVVEHAKETEEEAKKEKERVKNSLKDVRKKVKKDLEYLFHLSMSWSEKINGKEEDFIDVRLIESKGIRQGTIGLRFTQTFGEYLVRLPMTQYPTALLSIDERNPNAYKIGVKMMEHYNMDTNIRRNVHNRLKVGTLLKQTTLPGIEKVKGNKNSWESRIKESFENALDELTKKGFLSDYYYCLPGGAKMTDEEATSWTDYKEWEEALICFEIKNCDISMHDERRKRNEERKQTNKKRKTAKKKTDKDTASDHKGVE